MDKKPIQLGSLLSKQTGLFLSIGFGVFLFVLFFEPFPIENFDSNDKLLIIAGLGAIVFLFMVLIRIIYPWSIRNFKHKQELHIRLSAFIILVLCSVAFAFYLHYVARIDMSFYVVFKIALICLAPAVALSLHDTIKELELQKEALVQEKKVIQHKIEKYEEDILNKTIEFVSDNNTENLVLLIAEVAFIKSADNYVEIVYKEGDILKKKLLRNTLKNIEMQIRLYSNFIRCHRICIVNTHYIERLSKNYNNHWLEIKGYDEQLPVSRQYLLKLKEAI